MAAHRVGCGSSTGPDSSSESLLLPRLDDSSVELPVRDVVVVVVVVVVAATGSAPAPVAPMAASEPVAVVVVAAVPLPDGNALFTMLDITDSRRAEQALRATAR